MLQMRVFYAMKDARTPTLIMLVMTAVKIPLLLLCRGLLDGEHIVYGVMLVNGAGFVVGAVLGQVWLWVRLGHLRSRRSLRVGLITLSVSALGVGAAVLAGYAVPASLGPIAAAWVKLPVQTLLGIAVPFGLLALLRLPEFTPVTRRVAGLLRRFASC